MGIDATRRQQKMVAQAVRRRDFAAAATHHTAAVEEARLGVMNSNERAPSSPPITGVRRTTSPRKAAAEALSAIYDQQQVLDPRPFLENLTTPGSGSPSQLIVLQQKLMDRVAAARARLEAIDAEYRADIAPATIQAGWRGYVARAQRRTLSRLASRRREAAAVIQAGWRGWAVRQWQRTLRAYAMDEEADAEMRRQEGVRAAALCVQAGWRGCVDRSWIRRMRHEEVPQMESHIAPSEELPTPLEEEERRLIRQVEEAQAKLAALDAEEVVPAMEEEEGNDDEEERLDAAERAAQAQQQLQQAGEEHAVQRELEQQAELRCSALRVAADHDAVQRTAAVTIQIAALSWLRDRRFSNAHRMSSWVHHDGVIRSKRSASAAKDDEEEEEQKEDNGDDDNDEEEEEEAALVYRLARMVSTEEARVEAEQAEVQASLAAAMRQLELLSARAQTEEAQWLEAAQGGLATAAPGEEVAEREAAADEVMAAARSGTDARPEWSERAAAAAAEREVRAQMEGQLEAQREAARRAAAAAAEQAAVAAEHAARAEAAAAAERRAKAAAAAAEARAHEAELRQLEETRAAREAGSAQVAAAVAAAAAAEARADAAARAAADAAAAVEAANAARAASEGDARMAEAARQAETAAMAQAMATAQAEAAAALERQRAAEKAVAALEDRVARAVEDAERSAHLAEARSRAVAEKAAEEHAAAAAAADRAARSAALADEVARDAAIWSGEEVPMGASSHRALSVSAASMRSAVPAPVATPPSPVSQAPAVLGSSSSGMDAVMTPATRHAGMSGGVTRGEGGDDSDDDDDEPHPLARTKAWPVEDEYENDRRVVTGAAMRVAEFDEADAQEEDEEEALDDEERTLLHLPGHEPAVPFQEGPATLIPQHGLLVFDAPSEAEAEYSVHLADLASFAGQGLAAPYGQHVGDVDMQAFGADAEDLIYQDAAQDDGEGGEGGVDVPGEAAAEEARRRAQAVVSPYGSEASEAALGFQSYRRAMAATSSAARAASPPPPAPWNAAEGSRTDGGDGGGGGGGSGTPERTPSESTDEEAAEFLERWRAQQLAQVEEAATAEPQRESQEADVAASDDDDDDELASPVLSSSHSEEEPPEGYAAGLPSESADFERGESGEPHASLPYGWHRTEDSAGRAYFYHDESGAVSWTFPSADQTMDRETEAIWADELRSQSPPWSKRPDDSSEQRWHAHARRAHHGHDLDESVEEDSRWADISDDSTDILMEADSAVAMARSKEDVASQLYQTFAWIKYVANIRRRSARDMERAAKHWRRNVRSEPLGLHFEGWAAGAASKRMRIQLEERARRHVLHQTAQRWHRHTPRIDPAAQLARMTFEIKRTRAVEQGRRLNLRAAMYRFQMAVGEADVAAASEEQAARQLKRGWFARWHRRLNALRMVWMIETAEQHALGRRLDNWRGAARSLADVNQRASSLELRISWRRLARRTASTSRNRLLAERARANQVSYAFRQAFRRKWATWADDRAQAMRMALRARTHWARSSGVRRWHDAVCRQRGETLRMRRSIADWRAWAEYSKRLSATYCVDATIGQMHTALRCWWRLHDRNRWSSLTSRNLRMLRALRQLADSADRRAAAHKRALVASLFEVRLTRRRGFAELRRACAPPPPPPAPPTAADFIYVPPPQQRAVKGVWVPGGRGGSKHVAPARERGAYSVEAARLVATQMAADAARGGSREAMMAAAAATAALDVQRLGATATPSARASIEGALFSRETMALPRPGTSAYRGGRLSTARSASSARASLDGAAAVAGAVGGAKIGSFESHRMLLDPPFASGPKPIDETWEAAKAASQRRAERDQQRAAEKAAERRERISRRSWAPSLDGLQQVTAQSPGTWKAAPAAVRAQPFTMGANSMLGSNGTASPCAVRSSSSSNTLGGPSSGSAVTVSTSSHAAGVRPTRPKARPLNIGAPEETHWDGHGLPAAVAFTTSAPSMQTTSARRREKPWK